MLSKKLSLKEIPQDERPREKLFQAGEQSITDAELLAIVLGGGSKTETAVQLAQRILSSAGGLKQLAAMSVLELRSFHGIGPARAAQLKAALELARRYKEMPAHVTAFSNSRIVFEYFHPILRSQKQEEFWLVTLNAKNKLLGKHLLFKGTLTGSVVHPREVFEKAIRESAAGIIVLHNHPSGDPAPSLEDRKVTASLADAGKLM